MDNSFLIGGRLAEISVEVNLYFVTCPRTSSVLFKPNLKSAETLGGNIKDFVCCIF